MNIIPGELLSQIDFPADLRRFSEDELVQISNELRQYIIDIVSVKGGHFGASLGTVELSVALHYAFNTPYDQLVWDVGHQAYGHKMLTGRREQFHTNRIYKGLSGFPKRKESEYDTFGVGHSSTSISAALGMAVASRIKGENDRQHIAVIGDGALTGGMAFEGLNNAGTTPNNMLVILNDNCMSIDPNVGALKEYLTDITTSHTYNRVKDEVWNLLGKISKFGPNAQAIVQKVENAVKSALLQQSNLFESLNFRYFGPVDGHDVNRLVQVFKDLKDIPGPKILHVLTVKGKGGHAAMPQTYNSPLLLAAAILTRLHQFFMIDKTDNILQIPTVLAFGKVEGLGATNVIPDAVNLAGTFRTLDEVWRKKCHELMIEIANEIAQEMQGECIVDIHHGYPCLVNDEKITALCMQTASEIIGEQNIVNLDYRMTAEDFAYFSQIKPVCFYRLGTGNAAKNTEHNVHTNHFNIDEDVLKFAPAVMACMALDLLN
jgi:transketolase N-terminal domain/subunit